MPVWRTAIHAIPFLSPLSIIPCHSPFSCGLASPCHPVLSWRSFLQGSLPCLPGVAQTGRGLQRDCRTRNTKSSSAAHLTGRKHTTSQNHPNFIQTVLTIILPFLNRQGTLMTSQKPLVYQNIPVVSYAYFSSCLSPLFDCQLLWGWANFSSFSAVQMLCTPVLNLRTNHVNE